jgi:hypothetical protein
METPPSLKENRMKGRSSLALSYCPAHLQYTQQRQLFAQKILQEIRVVMVLLLKNAEVIQQTPYRSTHY